MTQLRSHVSRRKLSPKLKPAGSALRCASKCGRVQLLCVVVSPHGSIPLCLRPGEAKGAVHIHAGALQAVNPNHPLLELPASRVVVAQGFILDGGAAAVLSNRAVAQL